MSSKKSRVVPLVALALLLSSSLVGLAGAESTTRSVGAISVDAAGKARGANLNAVVNEAEGIIESYSNDALGIEVFGYVKVHGFVQTDKMVGVGSSQLILRGENAVISIQDNIVSLLSVYAVEATDVEYRLGSSVKTASSTGHSFPLYTPAGRPIGGLVVLGTDGKASAGSFLTADSDSRVTAHLERGSVSVFRANPSYVHDALFNDALIGMLSSGGLKAEIISEHSAGATAVSTIQYYGKVATTATVGGDGVYSSVLSRVEGGAIVAYDIAYETLAVDDADGFSVYVDGQLVQRASSPETVAARLSAGEPMYYSAKAEGRTLVIVSTPDFKEVGEHRISIIKSHAATEKSRSESQARAEARVALDSAVNGLYTLSSAGKAIGRFTSARIEADAGEIRDVVQLETKVQYVNSIRVEGSQGRPERWSVSDSSGKSLRLEGQDSAVVMTDDAIGTTIIQAKGEAVATVELGPGVSVSGGQDGAFMLKGPNGYVGTVVVARQDARAPDVGAVVADSKGRLVATLRPGYELIMRSSTESRSQASESAESAAVSSAEIGAQVVAGVDVNGRTTSGVSFFQGVAIQAQAQAAGTYDVSYRGVNGATSFIFDGRASALAMRSRSDIAVTVDGVAAVAYTTLAEVLAKKDFAAYSVESSASGEVRVVVNTVEADTKHLVEISSKLESDARGASRVDAFGTFRQFYDGSAIGSYVRLRALIENGVVSDYALMSTGTSVFTSIKMGASAFQSGGAEGVSTLVLENRETVSEIADTTAAWIKVVAKNEAEVTFSLAPQIVATQTSSSVVVLDGPDGFIGSIIVTDVEGRAATGSDIKADERSRFVHATLGNGAQLIFKTHAGIETELSDQQRDLMNKAIAAGRVGGQVVVQTKASLAAVLENAGDSAASASQRAGAKAQSLIGAASRESGSITTSMTAAYYNDVQIVTAATRDRVDITASSAVHAGKTIIVSLDSETIPTLAQGQAEILVDGEAAAQADSYADVLNPGDDGGRNEYFVLAGEAGTQVLISISHFSTRTVTLKSQDATGSPVFMYATMFLGVLVAAQSVMMWRKKR
ncbi:MAG: hypothetical protein HY556_06145 [Euryarchaeota archaeon]|nr:hypothetical protein [Euryarchaeota archaeon]